MKKWKISKDYETNKSVHMTPTKTKPIITWKNKLPSCQGDGLGVGGCLLGGNRLLRVNHNGERSNVCM